MQPSEEKSQLTISVTWASTLPQATAVSRIPSRVTFQYDYFPIIEEIFKKLRPTHEPTTPSLFVGYVDTLNGDPGADGQVQGDTRFLVVYEEEMVKARSDLNADDYQIAIRAHASGKAVKFQGTLHLGRRTHRIDNIQSLQIIDTQ
ncbi:MAG: hypothetical protein O3C40_22810 [Planctomycetota bacterium]|nr:hypothetical protein [Planctomycetota bacterium]